MFVQPSQCFINVWLAVCMPTWSIHRIAVLLFIVQMLFQVGQQDIQRI